MKNNTEAFIEDLYKIVNTIHDTSLQLDGRNDKVRHIRTAIFAFKDVLNKLERLSEINYDELHEILKFVFVCGCGESINPRIYQTKSEVVCTYPIHCPGCGTVIRKAGD